MKYCISYKDEVIFHTEITDYQKLIAAIEAEEGEMDDPLDFLFESLCEVILENPDSQFKFLEESGAKITVFYRTPPFDKYSMKTELF